MIRLLQSSWLAALAGCLVYLGSMVLFLHPGKLQLARKAVAEEKRAPADEPSWKFTNPEFDQWVEEITGISSAQQQMPMQKAEKTNEISAFAEQKLPGPAAGVTGSELPGKSLRSVHPASWGEKTDLALDIGSSSSGAAAPSGTASTAAVTAAWPSSTPLHSLERAHDLMSLHAFRLRDSGVDLSSGTPQIVVNGTFYSLSQVVSISTASAIE